MKPSVLGLYIGPEENPEECFMILDLTNLKVF